VTALGARRVSHPDRSWHDETALGGIPSDDVATRGAQAGDNRSRWRSSDSEFRADQESCGAVGPTARANRLSFRALFGSDPRPPRASPRHGPVTPPLISQWRGRAFGSPQASLERRSLYNFSLTAKAAIHTGYSRGVPSWLMTKTTQSLWFSKYSEWLQR